MIAPYGVAKTQSKCRARLQTLSINRREILLPLFIYLMMDNPYEDWAMLMTPVIEG
ncbi:hypothetical protein FHS52_001196 [Erythromicrobium ramosum]|uniref:Uncharacterized protein n=1 Tax=Erythrobacter ramosus TaxID=35811 RepID=A0ABR6HX94_9SPHN|nr:hypothetical protein [Erythrobacter ramosus]